jgi:hypothetical protein
MIEAQRSQMQSRVAAAAERIQSACRTCTMALRMRNQPFRDFHDNL